MERMDLQWLRGRRESCLNKYRFQKLLTVQRLQGSHQTSADVSQSHSCSHTSSTWWLWPSTCEGQRCWRSPVIRTWSCVINFHFYVLRSHSTRDKLYLAFTASQRHFCHIYPVWVNVHVYSQNDIWFRYALILYTTEETLMQSRTPAAFTFYNESPNKAVVFQVCYQWQTSVALFCVSALCLIWIILKDKVTVAIVMVWRVVGVGMHEVTSIETAAKDH